MVPYADLLNHNATGQPSPPLYGYHSRKQLFEVAADRDYAAGEEIRIFYGENSNTESLYNYGFVTVDNPSEQVTISVPALLPMPTQQQPGWIHGLDPQWRQQLLQSVSGGPERTGGPDRSDPGLGQGLPGVGEEELTEVHFTIAGLARMTAVMPTLRARVVTLEDVGRLGMQEIQRRLVSGVPVTPAGDRRIAEAILDTAVDAITSFSSSLSQDVADWELLSHGHNQFRNPPRHPSDAFFALNSRQGGTHAKVQGGGGSNLGRAGQGGTSKDVGNGGDGDEAVKSWFRWDENRRITAMLLLNIETKRIFHTMLLDSLRRIAATYLDEVPDVFPIVQGKGPSGPRRTVSGSVPRQPRQPRQPTRHGQTTWHQQPEPRGHAQGAQGRPVYGGTYNHMMQGGAGGGAGGAAGGAGGAAAPMEEWTKDMGLWMEHWQSWWDRIHAEHGAWRPKLPRQVFADDAE